MGEEDNEETGEKKAEEEKSTEPLPEGATASVPKIVNFFEKKNDTDDEVEETGRTNQLSEAEIQQDGK